MAKTSYSDVILPSNFADYVSEQSVNLARLFRSGAVVNVPGLAISKGSSISMPFIKPLTGSAQILADNASLTPAKQSTAAQKAIVFARGTAVSVNDLAAAYSGADLEGHIGDSLGQWWAEQLDAQGLATLAGAVASAAATHVHDISAGVGAAAVFSAGSLIDAQGKLGDARSKLAALVQHSAVTGLMDKQDLLTVTKNSDGSTLTSYRGMEIIEDDNLVAVSGVYTQYLVARGAIGFAESLDLNDIEVGRDILAGDTTVASRKAYVMHPMGFKCNLDVAANGITPSNAELADDETWTMVANGKNVGIVAHKFKLA